MIDKKSFNVVEFGEILWDLLPDKVVLGGAPFNFAYRIHSLGHNASIISSVGDDDLGKEALKQVRGFGMPTEYIQKERKYPTGTVKVILDESKKPDYNIITDVAYDHIRLEESLFSLIKEADCLCFGSLAQRNNESRETLQALLSSFEGRFRLYDINLRKNCYDRDVIHSCLLKTDLLKLNNEEALVVKDMLQLNAVGLKKIGEEIIRQYPVRACVITLGSNGVLALSSDDEIVYEPGYKVLMQDPLGAGDAFSAGFVSELLAGSDLRTACRFGNRMGAIVATQSGATQTITRTAMKVVEGKTRYNIQRELNDYFKA